MKDAPRSAMTPVLVAGAMAAGLAVSLAPHLALLGLGAAILWLREHAVARLWRLLNELAPMDALRAQAAWLPGRNMCRVFVWLVGVALVALGAVGLLHS